MAYNTKAWDIVKKYLPSHYIGSTGPCCDHCSLMYRAVVETQLEERADRLETNRAVNAEAYKLGYEAGKRDAHVDDPDMDGTDFAHPAWWRGHEYSFARSCKEINDILDGTKANVGASTQLWQQLRQRLYDIRTMLGIAQRVMDKVPSISPNKYQWDKIRREYTKRREQDEPARS